MDWELGGGGLGWMAARWLLDYVVYSVPLLTLLTVSYTPSST